MNLSPAPVPSSVQFPPLFFLIGIPEATSLPLFTPPLPLPLSLSLFLPVSTGGGGGKEKYAADFCLRAYIGE